MPRRQPPAHIGRHQKRLLAITRDKALAHHEIVLNPPDDTPTYATATGEGASAITAHPRPLHAKDGMSRAAFSA
jgi:hypothetical protein